MTTIQNFYFIIESFCKCQNCYTMFWKFRGGNCSPWLRACCTVQNEVTTKFDIYRTMYNYSSSR